MPHVSSEFCVGWHDNHSGRLNMFRNGETASQKMLTRWGIENCLDNGKTDRNLEELP